MPQVTFIKKLTILTALIGTVLFGWLSGHILRHSIPEYQFRHSPVPEIDPHIENGYETEFEGIRRMAVWMENPAVRIFTDEGTLYLGEILIGQCAGNTYYTSLPAKCQSMDGNWAQVGNGDSDVFLIPENK